VGNTAGFQGHEHDSATGLVFARNRWLDPELGRFVSADPLGYVDGPSAYAFAGNHPESAGDPLGLALYAFDGTGDSREDNTNVAKLVHAYQGRKPYYRGVGSNWLTKIPCGVTGCGGHKRIRWASSDLATIWQEGDHKIDIIGFSRGAAIGRAWANVIDREGILDRRTGKTIKPSIRFMGLFDTVASFGIPGNGIDLGYDFSIPPNVQTVRHAVAENAYRGTFPLMEARDPSCPPDDRIVEKSFEGAHSAIGGGYKDDDTLSRIPLSWMWNEMKLAGLPMAPLEEDHASVSSKYGNLKRHKPWESILYWPSWIRVDNAERRGEAPQRKVFNPGCPRRR
jgi:RHS repeat-associated protein